ncbi:flavin-containing monooxygenase [Lacisediminihabitans sp.]|uniref:flavin-containing monooxygenase n=1 Tax=Lacisediminihabitans sp. TaxID=2787631 RepID=UPI00374D2EAB
MSTEDPPARADAVVIGAGPGGLAVAAQLRRAGFTPVVLDRALEVGSSWAAHYDRLHLHTARTLSSLPGLPIPREYGRWVARDDFRRYLSDYAAHHRLDLRLGVTVTGVSQGDDGWRVGWRSAASAGTVETPIVVVATGYNHEARMPSWPGLAEYRGRVIHSSEYRNPAELAAHSVLVVGPGNSGGEIAADLAEAGVRVQLAVRTPPNIVRRQVAGIPGQVLVLSISPLPTPAGDRVARLVQRLSVGDLTRFGLPPAPRGIVTQMERDDVTPTIDVGLLAALRRGAVTVVPAVASFTTDAVVLVDGTEVRPDVVIAATGFARGLEPIVGELRVLAPSGRPLINAAAQLAGLGGLYFLGYSNPLTGNIRQLAIDARAIARHAGRRSAR